MGKTMGQTICAALAVIAVVSGMVDCLCNMDPGHCHLDEAALAQSLGVVHVKCTQEYEGGDHAGHDHGETDAGRRRLKQDDHEVHWQCGNNGEDTDATCVDKVIVHQDETETHDMLVCMPPSVPDAKAQQYFDAYEAHQICEDLFHTGSEASECPEEHQGMIKTEYMLEHNADDASATAIAEFALMAYNECETALDATSCDEVSTRLAAMDAPTLVESAVTNAGSTAAALTSVLMAVPILLASML